MSLPNRVEDAEKRKAMILSDRHGRTISLGREAIKIKDEISQLESRYDDIKKELALLVSYDTTIPSLIKYKNKPSIPSQTKESIEYILEEFSDSKDSELEYANDQENAGLRKKHNIRKSKRRHSKKRMINKYKSKRNNRK